MHTDMNRHYVQGYELKSGMVVVRSDVINARPVTIKKKPKNYHITNDSKAVTIIETEHGEGVIYSDTMFALLSFDRRYL